MTRKYDQHKLNNIKVKSNANYTCQECGSTEMLQAHHRVPKDDDTLICLCAECHSNKHPDIPKGLFFSDNHQPYWKNISASSLAKELGVCSRTIIRAIKKLNINDGVLSDKDREIIKNNVKHVATTTIRSKLDLVQFREELKSMSNRDALYKIVKEELELRGWCKQRPRGKPNYNIKVLKRK